MVYQSGEVLFGNAKPPGLDCLLLDIRLRWISEVELSRQLAASDPTTPAIVITAGDGPGECERAPRIRDNACLCTSEPAESLLATLHRAIESNAVRPESKFGTCP